MRNIDLFDEYLHDTLSQEDKSLFEEKLRTDAEFKNQFDEHCSFITLMQEQDKQYALKNKLNQIYTDEFGTSNVYSLNSKPNFYNKYGRMMWVAASVTVIAVLSTIALLSSGGYLIKKHDTSITNLSKEITQIKSVQEGIIDGIKAGSQKRNFKTANIEGTGFLLNNKGYFLTSLHMVNKADSVFITNGSESSFRAHVVLSDPRLDVAILKVDNDSLLKSIKIPYSFKSTSSDMGEKVFTLGYPAESIVYGDGTISSLKGSGDTAMYQISVPINPGNSGGPLFDEQGNIIGLIKSKNSNAEGTGYAVKGNYIMDLLKGIENDTLKKDIQLSTKRNTTAGLKRSEQIKRIQSCVYNVKVYKKN